MNDKEYRYSRQHMGIGEIIEEDGIDYIIVDVEKTDTGYRYTIVRENTNYNGDEFVR